MSSKSPTTVRYISECYIKPKNELQEHRKLINLTTWDVAVLSVRYMQCGFLYPKPRSNISSLLDELKESLSIALVHFYTLAGQLETRQSSDDKNNISIFINSTKDVPHIVDSFFDPYRAVNHDGDHLPLLTIQVTQLQDGIFIGCSMNHACADGSSYWHFLNSWSEIFMKKISINNGDETTLDHISRPPIHARQCFSVKLPFTGPHEYTPSVPLYSSQSPFDFVPK